MARAAHGGGKHAAAPSAAPADAKHGAPQPAAPSDFRDPAGQAAPADALAALAQAAGHRRAPQVQGEPAKVAAVKALPADTPGGRPAEAKAPVAEPASTPSRIAPAPAREDKADPLVGTSINGFKVQGRIGTGGFGIVYRAFDTNLERSVAIKMLPPRIAKAGQGLLDRFLREARSAAKLSHPNIVTIHQICPYGDTFYIVMELVDGGALHERLAAQRRFEPVEATRVVRAAAEGLGHAHRRGIIHRDIKPGNIMLTKDGGVKVSDFGLARDVLQGRDIVGPGHSLGTPRYMAPEQALGEEPTAASDLYSLSATYYALLTGRPPFDAGSDREVMKKHVTEEVPDPRQFVPELPVAVFRFFEKAMAKEPEDRYQTAEDFVEALDRLDFSAADGTLPPSPQALSAQLGKIAAEDRGSHLSEALGRAVRRAQRQHTPLAAPAAITGVTSKVKTAKRGWVLWFVIALVAVILAGVVGGAFWLASLQQNKPPPVPESPPAKSSGTAQSPTTEPGTKVPGTQEAVTPPEKTPEKVPEKATEPAKTPAVDPIEKAAREALDLVRKEEANPAVPREEIITLYEENVLNIKAYAGTKAYQEAEQAVKRLRAAPPPEKKPETPPPEKPAEESKPKA